MKHALYRVGMYAIQNFVRNIGLSVMTVTILVLALLSINTLIVVNSLTHASLVALESRVDVSIDFYPESDSAVVQEIFATVKQMPEIKEVQFLTAEEVRNQFEYRFKDDEGIVAGLSVLDHNPFGPSLLVQASEPSDYEKILGLLDNERYNAVIEEKSFGEHAAVLKKISDITTNIRKTAMVFAGVFALFAFFIIFNTIRVALYTQREEISIMRLVGASKWFIRAPFYTECFIHVALALLIAMAATLLAIEVIDPYIQTAFTATQFSILVDIHTKMLGIVVIEFAAVFLLTLIAATVAMSRYLKV